MDGQRRVGLVVQAQAIFSILLSLTAIQNTESGKLSELEEDTIQLFADLLDGYDKRIRPNYGSDEPCVDTVQLYMASFDDIAESDMSYSFTIYLRQAWDDPRLTYDESRELPPSSFLVDKIWVPDLMFGNERKAVSHDVTTDNKVVQITPNGSVWYSVRISLTLHCDMDFHKFPMDQQKCGLEVESFQYTIKDLVFQWVENEPAEFNKAHLKLPQYSLRDTTIENCTKQLSTGWFTCIGITFRLDRELGYYLLQTYIPSILLIILSWVSFWIDIKASPARVALGITSVLTMITTLNGVREDLPHVSYIKAIDVWFAMCLIFVVGSLIEYAIVHYLSTNKLRLWRHRSPSKVEKAEKYTGECCVSMSIVDQSRSVPASRSEANGEGVISNGGNPEAISSISGSAAEEGRIWIRGNCSRKPEAIYDTGKKVDNVCRVAFPCAFVLFNLGYWTYYKLV
ncbi:glycine receptor subunit alpha-3-like [Ptychodera flava]|uniref:glycine receptor subunit alpha-3-like n=1 Tax=Ptychodera flava TaxID=63121 RepID=UPI00396A8979